MKVEDIALEEVPVLRALSAAKRKELLRNTIQHSVAPGTVLFEQSDVPNFQLVAMSGSAQLFGRSAEGREVLIEVVRAPDLVIPAAVVTGASYLMQASVPEPSRFLLIHAASFREAVAADPALAQAVIGSLAQQFRRMVRQIKNLKLRSSTQRVGCCVLALSARQGTPHCAVLPYEKNLIASELGMTRESFSRAMASLEKSGIAVEGQTIMIADGSRLAAEYPLDPLIDGEDASNMDAAASKAGFLPAGVAGRPQTRPVGAVSCLDEVTIPSPALIKSRHQCGERQEIGMLLDPMVILLRLSKYVIDRLRVPGETTGRAEHLKNRHSAYRLGSSGVQACLSTLP